MLKEQFYYRLLLIVAFGFIYVRTMMKMALYKPTEGTKKNLVMKIVGGVFILLALFEGVIGIYLLTQVQHPTKMIDFIPTPNQIVRPSSTHIIWGHATEAQWYVISMITNTMILLGIGAYFFFYRKSVSKWWKKILKFLFGILLCVFYVNATDFHYFDILEFWPLVFFSIMVFVVIMKARRSSKVTTPQEILSNNSDLATEQAEQVTPSQDDETRFMPKAIDEEVNEHLSTFDKEEPKEFVLQTKEVEEKPVYIKKINRRCFKIRKWWKRILIALVSVIVLCVGVYWIYNDLYLPYHYESLYNEGLKDVNKADEIALELYHIGRDEEAIEVLTNSAKKGNLRSMVLLGRYYMNHRFEIDLEDRCYEHSFYNRDKCSYWYLQAAKLNNAEAQCELGFNYLYGHGVKQDFAKAIYWIKQGADNGDAVAQWLMGNLYANGLAYYRGYTDLWWYNGYGFIAKDNPERYLNKEYVAEMKSREPEQIFLLPNIKKAKFYWRLAANQGLQKAKDSLERIYEGDD